MTAQRQAWILAHEDADWAAVLARRLEERGLHVEIVGSGLLATWRGEGRLPTVRSLPHVIFIGGDVAGQDEFEVLRFFDRPGPWRGPPRIVVVDSAERAFIDRCYALGVSNVVLFAATSTPAGQAAVETTARYWTQTSILPNAEYFVADSPS